VLLPRSHAAIYAPGDEATLENAPYAFLGSVLGYESVSTRSVVGQAIYGGNWFGPDIYNGTRLDIKHAISGMMIVAYGDDGPLSILEPQVKVMPDGYFGKRLARKDLSGKAPNAWLMMPLKTISALLKGGDGESLDNKYTREYLDKAKIYWLRGEGPFFSEGDIVRFGLHEVLHDGGVEIHALKLQECMGFMDDARFDIRQGVLYLTLETLGTNVDMAETYQWQVSMQDLDVITF
jgi:hypothetical protein